MINLLFAGNEKVFDGVLLCLLSLISRQKENNPLNVIMLTMDVTRIKPDYTPITEKQRGFLEKILKDENPESKVTLKDVTSLYESEFKLCPNESAYCSPYTLIRLFADKIKEIPDKILYLDADVMFNRDVRLLYDFNVSDFEYAAARDNYGRFLIRPDYINAGVLLFNMKKCRETGIFEKARKLIKTKKLVFADQSALIRSTTKKKLLSCRFNDQKFLFKKTVIRHFSKRLYYFPYPHTDNIKQWHVEKVHKVLKYRNFDDIYDKYFTLKEQYDEK